MLSNLPKPVSFAILGAIGCFVAAFFVGEPLHLLLEPTPPPPPKKTKDASTGETADNPVPSSRPTNSTRPPRTLPPPPPIKKDKQG